MFIRAGIYTIHTQTISHVIREKDRLIIHFVGDKTVELEGDDAHSFTLDFERFSEGKLPPGEYIPYLDKKKR